jgi:hypothetical protein
LVIIRLLLISNNSDLEQTFDDGLLFRATYKGCYTFPQGDFLDNNDSIFYYLIDLNLKNTTSKQIEFITFSCTPFVNVVLKTNEFKICQNRCVTNQFNSVFLNPGQEFKIPLIIKGNEHVKSKCISIGWALLTKENTKRVDNYFYVLKRARKDFKNVLWSNEICVDNDGGYPIEIN